VMACIIAPADGATIALVVEIEPASFSMTCASSIRPRFASLRFPILSANHPSTQPIPPAFQAAIATVILTLFERNCKQVFLKIGRPRVKKRSSSRHPATNTQPHTHFLNLKNRYMPTPINTETPMVM
jgi:hypothetical protein